MRKKEYLEGTLNIVTKKRIREEALAEQQRWDVSKKERQTKKSTSFQRETFRAGPQKYRDNDSGEIKYFYH